MKSLIEEEWFHGVLPREEVVRLLTKEGDFLVRETTRNDENQTVLSVCWGGHKHFIVQTTSDVSIRLTTMNIKFVKSSSLMFFKNVVLNLGRVSFRGTLIPYHSRTYYLSISERFASNKSLGSYTPTTNTQRTLGIK